MNDDLDEFEGVLYEIGVGNREFLDYFETGFDN